MKGRSSSKKHHLRRKGHEEQEKKVNDPLSENLHLFSITSRLQSIYFTSWSSHRSNYHWNLHTDSFLLLGFILLKLTCLSIDCISDLFSKNWHSHLFHMSHAIFFSVLKGSHFYQNILKVELFLKWNHWEKGLGKLSRIIPVWGKYD